MCLTLPSVFETYRVQISKVIGQKDWSFFLSLIPFEILKQKSDIQSTATVSLDNFTTDSLLLISGLNRLTPNDPYTGRTAPLTSKLCILYIYSTNIGTEYFKHALYSPFFLFKIQFVS